MISSRASTSCISRSKHLRDQSTIDLSALQSFRANAPNPTRLVILPYPIAQLIASPLFRSLCTRSLLSHTTQAKDPLRGIELFGESRMRCTPVLPLLVLW